MLALLAVLLQTWLTLQNPNPYGSAGRFLSNAWPFETSRMRQFWEF